MAGYMKKIFIIGNVGRDPETRYTGDGTQVTSFSVAVNDRARRSQGGDAGQGGQAAPGGQAEEKTDWFRVTAWRRQAEVVSQFVKKGTSICVSGTFSTREYTDRDGKLRTSLEIDMQDMTLLSARTDEQGGGGFDGGSPSYGSRPASAQGGATGSRPAPAPDAGFDSEDDVPF